MMKEDEITELKKNTGELNEGMVSIASILNKHRRGTLYFGIKNDGTPHKFTITETISTYYRIPKYSSKFEGFFYFHRLLLHFPANHL